ncbi:MAG: asparagine synthase (glutamine-hydrolyzing) [Phycisphaerae bacterium]
MCGIIGGISAEPFDWLAEPGRLARAVDVLAHRGPDDRGQYMTADRRAFLGHRRLSIIDIEGGREPLADESGRRRLSYNGEIYNYKALRRELEGRGHCFRTRTDGEVALHSYEEDPIDFPVLLSGMFAIAILDETTGSVTLARDRNGIKPLYYFHDGRSLLFASEIKAILAALPRRPPLCVHALRQYLRWKYVPAPLTIFEHLYKLLPGTLLRAVRDDEQRRVDIETHRYWRRSYDGEKVTDEAAALDALDQKLRSAVESHLVSDVEVGTLLSGGVDSSLITALASILTGGGVKTFSVGFAETGFDQRPFARTLAQKYRTDHHEACVDLDPMATLPKLVRQFDEPFADSSALACYHVCEVASRHVKVVLTGDGGDESFAGYKRYAEVQEAVSSNSAWRRAANRAAYLASAAVFSPEGKFLRRWRAASYPPLEQHEHRQVLCGQWLADRLLADAYRRTDGPAIFSDHRADVCGRGWSPVEVAQYVDLQMYLPDDILTKVDRTSMACSLECRVPLLDHSITEFSATLDVGLKIRGGVRKYLLKRLAERYVPRELLYRPKMGFRVPIRRWFKRGLLDQTADLLMDGALVESGIIDRAGLTWLLRAQWRPWMDFGSQLWALLWLEHWARVYLV